MTPEVDAGSTVINSVVKVAVEGATTAIRVSGHGALGLAKIVANEIRHPSKVRGKTSMRGLYQRSSVQKVYDIAPKDLKSFAIEAKRFGVLYYVARTEKNADTLKIIVAAEDASKLDRIFERLNIGVPDPATIERTNADVPTDQTVTVTDPHADFVESFFAPEPQTTPNPFQQGTESPDPSATSSDGTTTADPSTEDPLGLNDLFGEAPEKSAGRGDDPARTTPAEPTVKKTSPNAEKTANDNPTTAPQPAARMKVREVGAKDEGRPSVRAKLKEYATALAAQRKRRKDRSKDGRST